MIFGCDGVFDTPDNTGLPTTQLTTLTLGGTTLTVNSTASFAPAGTLLIAGPGNTTQTVTYTGISGDSFTGVQGGTGTFTSAAVFGLTATTASFTNNLTLPIPAGGVLAVPSTTGFPSQGQLVISGTGDSNQTVSYTGTAPGSFNNVIGGTGSFTSYTATATLSANSSFSTVPTATVKDIMNSIASAFNRGLTPRQSAGTFGPVLAPSYWASDPNPLQAAATTGGTLAAGGKYRYVITAVNINSGFSSSSAGETPPSNEVEVDLATGSNAVKLSWPAINLPGGPSGAMTAESFNIYRSTYDATTGTFGPLLLIQKGLVNGPTDPTSTYVDTGTAPVTPATSPPFVYYAAGSTANFYAAYLHLRDVSINGLAYGFPYDDQGGFSTNVQMPTPNQVTIGLGTWTATTKLDVTAPAPVAGTPTAVTITARDSSGNVDTSYAGTVFIANSDPKAVPRYLSHTFTPSDKGVFVFDTTFKTVGAQTLTFTDPANALTASTPLTVAPEPPASLVFLAQPTPALLGATETVSVEALDAAGNLDTAAQGTVTPTGLPKTMTAPIQQGVATFQLTLGRAGAFKLDATASFGSVLSQVFDVATATHFGFGPIGPVVAGKPFTFTVDALRPNGSIDHYYARTVRLYAGSRLVGTAAAVGGKAVFLVTLPQAGPVTLSARDFRVAGLLGQKVVTVRKATV